MMAFKDQRISENPREICNERVNKVERGKSKEKRAPM